MNAKPRLLDLFCGAGGCAVGYARAGFDVFGVDHESQPRYPFPFFKGDALMLLKNLMDDCPEDNGGMSIHDFAAIHASPPCQGYSRMRHLPWLKGREYPMLLDPCRELLDKTGKVWVIENVEDAPLCGVTLCGLMFGLKVYRHRKFESNVLLMQPPHQKHVEVIGRGRMLNDRSGASAAGFVSLPSKSKPFAGRTVSEKGTLNHNYHSDGVITVGGHNFKASAAAKAMGIDWMNRNELAQAIPPAYTEFVGRQLVNVLS